MKIARRLVETSLLVATLAAWGTGCATSNLGATVATTPPRRMTGVVDGYPFPVRTAWVRPIADRPGLWELHIADDDDVCGLRGEHLHPLRHQFVATTRWETGASRTFDAGDPTRAGVTTLEDRSYGFVPMTEGRLDVLFAPTSPSRREPDGKVRLDARDRDGNEFHGEVDVTTCDV